MLWVKNTNCFCSSKKEIKKIPLQKSGNFQLKQVAKKKKKKLLYNTARLVSPIITFQ